MTTPNDLYAMEPERVTNMLDHLANALDCETRIPLL